MIEKWRFRLTGLVREFFKFLTPIKKHVFFTFFHFFLKFGKIKWLLFRGGESRPRGDPIFDPPKKSVKNRCFRFSRKFVIFQTKVKKHVSSTFLSKILVKKKYFKRKFIKILTCHKGVKFAKHECAIRGPGKHNSIRAPRGVTFLIVLKVKFTKKSKILVNVVLS